MGVILRKLCHLCAMCASLTYYWCEYTAVQVWRHLQYCERFLFQWNAVLFSLLFIKESWKTCVTLDTKPVFKSLGYICSNSQKYTAWVKIIHFSFIPQIIRVLSKDHLPWRYLVNYYRKYIKTCIAKKLIWTILKGYSQCLDFFCTLRFQIFK